MTTILDLYLAKNTSPGGKGKSVHTREENILKGRDSMKICTYNIIHGGGSRMELAIKKMKNMNINLGVLTETKVSEGMYTKVTQVYTIIKGVYQASQIFTR
jgi:hypothetical protein